MGSLDKNADVVLFQQVHTAGATISHVLLRIFHFGCGGSDESLGFTFQILTSTYTYTFTVSQPGAYMRGDGRDNRDSSLTDICTCLFQEQQKACRHARIRVHDMDMYTKPHSASYSHRNAIYLCTACYFCIIWLYLHICMEL